MIYPAVDGTIPVGGSKGVHGCGSRQIISDLIFMSTAGAEIDILRGVLRGRTAFFAGNTNAEQGKNGPKGLLHGGN